jgi:hypothetical protein
MKRWPIMVAVFGLLGPVALAQQPDGTVISSDLVLWSYMQRPQPPEENQPGQPPTSEATAEAQPAPIPNEVSPGELQKSGTIAKSQEQPPVEYNSNAPQQEDANALQVADH